MMNDKNMNFTDIPGAAEAASLAVEQKRREIREEYNRRRIKLIRLGGMVLLTSIIMIFATRSWFTMSRETEGTGANMTAEEMPFEIKVQGSKGYSDSYLPMGENGYTRLTEGTSGSLITSGSQQKIEWLVTSDYHAKNYNDSENPNFVIDEDIGIRPGDSGLLRFWIVPNENASETMTFTYHLDITAYKKVYPVDDETGKVNYDGTPTAVKLTDTAADKELASFIDSHILFFRYHGDDPDDKTNTKYSKLIDDTVTEEITFTDKNKDGKLDPYEIKIHWIWPETLGEAVLTDDDLSGGRTAVCKSENKVEKIMIGTEEREVFGGEIANELLEKFNKDPSAFLKGYELPEGVTSLSQADIKKDYSTLSIRYNNADQEIGDNIMYLTAEMSVSAGS